jgi:hypothetical protein
LAALIQGGLGSGVNGAAAKALLQTSCCKSQASKKGQGETVLALFSMQENVLLIHSIKGQPV